MDWQTLIKQKKVYKMIDLFNSKNLLDPGHGGTDPGAVNNNLGLKESYYTYLICKRIQEGLAKYGINFDLSRGEGQTLDPNPRQALARKYNICISIHLNSTTNKAAHGTESIYQIGNDEGFTLATCIINELVADVGLEKRDIYVKPGTKDPNSNYYFMLRTEPCTSIIVEVLFISNDDEAKKLQNVNYIADQIAQGILKYAGFVEVTVKGKQMPCMGFVKDGLTYYPVRYVADALGLPVTWDETLRRANIG